MKKTGKIFCIIIGLLFSFVAITCLNHRDLEYISTWGVTLLEHIHQGNLSSYAIDLFQAEYGTNYNLFQNINVAIWCLPLYLFSIITNTVIPMIGYQICIKLVVAVLHVFCAFELSNVIVLLGFDRRKAETAALLYFFSPIVMIHGIGIGQIDCLGILFFLLSVRFLLEKKYIPMSIMMGLALLSKLFVVIFYVPLFLLNFDKIRSTIKYACITVSIPIVDKIITKLLIDNYSLQADVHNTESFIPRLFNWSLGYESFILLMVFILCGICLLIGNRGRAKEYYYFLFSSIIFWFFLLLVFWHPQWFIYIFVVLLMMGCYISNEYEYAFFYTGLVGGFTIHSLVNCNLAYFNAMLVSESLLGKFVFQEQEYIGEWMINHISKYLGNIGYTILMASFILLIILYYINVSDKEKDKTRVNILDCIWRLIAFIPSGLYMVLVIMMYL